MRLSRYITIAAAMLLLAGTTAYSQGYSFDRETGLVRTETGQLRCPEFARLLKEDISRAGCNTNSFEFKGIHDTPAPKGYKPFYVSHYGRHGSRSNWGGHRYKRLADSLQRAKDAGLLTASGDSLLTEVRQVYAFHDGMDGRLTPRGCEEHKMLARRLYNRYPKVFKQKGYEVRARSSTVQRCIVSMTAFTNELTITGDGKVTYSSSKESVATVDADGKVTIKGVGETTITATVTDGTNFTYATKTATYTLKVLYVSDTQLPGMDDPEDI